MKSEISLVEKMGLWTVSQEPYRLPYIAAMLMIQSCVLVPASLYSMRAAGGGDFQLGIIVSFSMLVVTLNLAAQPTKITLPVFAINIVVVLLLTIYNVLTVLI